MRFDINRMRDKQFFNEVHVDEIEEIKIFIYEYWI